MKTMLRWMTTGLAAAVMCAAAFGQDAGNTSAVATAPPLLRPGERQPTYSVTPTAPVRGSLFRQGAEAPVPVNAEGEPVGSAPVSFLAVDPPKPRMFRKNDLLTVVVAEDSQSATTAKTDAQKQQTFDAALQQFIQLALSKSGLPTVTTVGNPSTLPEVKFNYNNNRQNQADSSRTDTASLRISATVVDVKPNGTLVIEATKKIEMDKEVQDITLSRICRAADVAADNTILSTQLANLSLSKQTTGQVRDGTRRGWLNSLIDAVNPF